MAINLTTNYSKKLGLPGYSSHAFSVSLEIELATSDDLPREIARLYSALQENVDAQIQQAGFIPPADYGLNSATPPSSPSRAGLRGHSPPENVVSLPESTWACSPKQRDLIEKIMRERGMSQGDFEHLSGQRFGKSLRQLNKLEASGLIDLLFQETGPGSRRGKHGKGGAR